MKKKIDFIKLCELIKEGRQPKVIEATIKYELLEDECEIFIWNECRYEKLVVDSEKDVPLMLEQRWTLWGLLKAEYVYDEEILTDKEKEYLSNLIKPWREDIECITKKRGFREKREGFEYVNVILRDDDLCALPNFEKGKYYKNMDLDIEYSLEDLGL